MAIADSYRAKKSPFDILQKNYDICIKYFDS